MDTYNSSDTTESLLSSFDPVASIEPFMPFIIYGTIASTVLLVVLFVISTLNHKKQQKAVRQSQQDIHAIRELLEKRFGATVTYQSRQAPLTSDLNDDPQVPARP